MVLCSHRLQGSRGMTAAAKSKRNETVEERAARKELVKQQKAEKKARREGKGDEGYGQKPCTLCHQQKDLLIRHACLTQSRAYFADKFIAKQKTTCTYIVLNHMLESMPSITYA